MSAMASPPAEANKEEKEYGKRNETMQAGDEPLEIAISVREEASDLLALQEIDPALNAKMHIVNNVRIS